MIEFKDRSDAGEKLSTLLTEYTGTNAIILAIPRGGVIVGDTIARILKLPLDIIVTRKIGAPGNEEYAIGAIDIEGNGIFNEQEVATVDKKWLKKAIAKEKIEAERRFTLYRGSRGPLVLKGKTVIIVDDGIATGLTIKAAIQYARKMGAEKVIVASPVASPETTRELAILAETRILATPSFFFAVAQFYRDFPQTSDEEVIAILAEVIHSPPSPIAVHGGILIHRFAESTLRTLTQYYMANSKYIWGIIGLIIIAGIVWWSMTKEDSQPQTTDTNVMMEGAMVPTGMSDTGTSVVTYGSNGFSPAEMKVKMGTMVTFMNQSNAPMWVASAVHPTHMLYPEFDEKASVMMGGSYSFTFGKAGTHMYHNHLNPAHRAKIVVE